METNRNTVRFKYLHRVCQIRSRFVVLPNILRIADNRVFQI